MGSVVRQSVEKRAQLPAIDSVPTPAPYQSPALPVSSKLDIFQNQHSPEGRTLLSRTRSSHGGLKDTAIKKPGPTRLYQKMESSFQASQRAAEEERRLHLARKHKISQYQRPAQAKLVQIDYHRQAPARSGLDGYLQKQYGLEDIRPINGRTNKPIDRPDPYQFFDVNKALIPTNASSSPGRLLTKSDSSHSVNSMQTRVR